MHKRQEVCLRGEELPNFLCDEKAAVVIMNAKYTMGGATNSTRLGKCIASRYSTIKILAKEGEDNTAAEV